MSTFRWGAITSVSPLKVKLDGDVTVESPVTNSTVDSDSLTVADRVRCELDGSRVIIVGKAGGVPIPVPEHVPAGVVSPFAGSSLPTDYLWCDGASYTTAGQAALFAVIGYTYGGSGANFNVPNLKGRFPVGVDTAQTDFDLLGETGGAKTHSHTLTSVIAAWFSGFYKSRVASSWTATNTHTATVGTGSSSSTTNGIAVEGSTDTGSSLPPYLVLQFIIKT